MSILSKINDLIEHAEDLVIDMSVPVAARRAALKCADEMKTLVGPLEEVIGLVEAEVRSEASAEAAAQASQQARAAALTPTAPTPAQVAPATPVTPAPADPAGEAAPVPAAPVGGPTPTDVVIPAPATTTHQPDQPADTTPATTAPVPDPAPAEATAAVGVDPAVVAAVQQVLAERQATGSQGVQG